MASHPLMIDYDRLEQVKGKSFANGQRLMDQGNFAAAEKEFSKAIEEKHPGNQLYDLYSTRAEVRLSQKNFSGALADMDASIASVGKPPMPDKIGLSCLYQIRARALSGLGRVKEAEADFTKAISLWSANGRAHMNLGLLYDKTARKALALSELNKAKEIMKNSKFNAPELQQIDAKLAQLQAGGK